MKRICNIFITATVLVLLTFGGSGIGVAQCACSGEMSLLLPDSHGCCPTEGGCMTVTTLQVSASHLADGVDVPATMSVALPGFDHPTPSCRELRPVAVAACLATIAPPGISQSMVMRV